MKLNLPKIVRPVRLGDFAPEFEKRDDGTLAEVMVWINPPAPVVARYEELRARGVQVLEKIKGSQDDADALTAARAEFEAVAASLQALYAELWSQAGAETHWTAAEVKELAGDTENPTLFRWLTGRTIQMIYEHRSDLRKN